MNIQTSQAKKIVSSSTAYCTVHVAFGTESRFSLIGIIQLNLLWAFRQNSLFNDTQLDIRLKLFFLTIISKHLQWQWQWHPRLQ